ncbi:hypothetical protein [Agrococcus beijingensis]|uniref:hypothetical protein n=1 Tax=Agrococcus beijingensis TaxID=3068634 RepID=UPI00274266A9|nr:hypothetical protein [Agrococcus sp. REN33]
MPEQPEAQWPETAPDEDRPGDDRPGDDRPGDDRTDDLMFEDLRRDDEVLTDPNDVEDDGLDAPSDASGRSDAELSDRAHAVIGLEHDIASPELQPDDASAAVQALTERRGPDADDRPV